MSENSRKKLLILGANYTECDIVLRAKQLGYYTIVTDNHEDWSICPAKQIADEGWNISWSDIDKLYEKCVESQVAGVLAGFSEFRVENMIKLCAKLHVPCPLTMEQLDVTRDKIKFKEACKQFSIPCVKDYQLTDDIQFPVIIKPVDRAGSIGINIAYNQEELSEYYNYALSLSPTKRVIIEEYIEDGTKVDVYYFVEDGKPTLLGTSDTIMCEGEEGAKILQKAWTFPSVFEEQYKKEVDGYIKGMLKGLGIEFGYATISMFYYHQHFYVFETGFRLSGDMSYNYYKAQTGKDYLDTIIRYTLGDYQDEGYKEIEQPICSVILNIFGKNGNVHEIKGLDQIKALPAVIAINTDIKNGDVIENETNVFKKIAMFTIASHNQEEVYRTTNAINEYFRVEDENGNDLVYERTTPEQLEYLIAKEIPLKTAIGNSHSFKIVPKPHFISYLQIQDLLNKAHQENEKKNLKYATSGQDINTLKQKLQNAVCLVALTNDNRLIGTASIQFRKIYYWYHNGDIGLLKLLAVDPQYHGNKIADKLVKERIEIAKKHDIQVVVSDSAEQNEIVRHLLLSNGFNIVDSCIYRSNNFYTVVYAKWLNGCPWSKTYMRCKYFINRLKTHFKYKPGKGGRV